ncbi:MAG: addiction module toxin RelE [Candidatus Woesearchaeota archaeon]
MREFSVEDELKKTVAKLFKKDKVTYEILMKKIEEILSCKNMMHYKNLRSPMQDFKRVHVRGPFVLTFKYIASKDKVIFYDFDHHDYIYRKNS